VSIGLPVFNGADYLVGAIESVVAQTWTDWELIICDNASTDATADIARSFAEQDPRIRFVRHPSNVGAAANFNSAFAHARGEYFQWLAHDDALAPDFISDCHAALLDQPSAVLAFPWVTIVDETGARTDSWELESAVDSPHARNRFEEIVLGWHNSFYIFGLIRSRSLRASKLILPQAHGDTILLARLALLGPFVQVRRHLFMSRKHSGQSNKLYLDPRMPRGFDLVAYSSWFNAPSAPTSRYPFVRLIREYYGTLDGVALAWRDHVACRATVLHLALRYRRGLRMDAKHALAQPIRVLRSRRPTPMSKSGATS
jgi:glycosyltransferase involved in cell wall biosynthesis